MSRTRRIRSFLLVCFLTAGLLIPATSPGASCAFEPGELYLAEFDSPPSVAPFYARPENGGPARATIRPLGGGCPDPITEGSYETEDGRATAPPDYQAVIGETGQLCVNDDGSCPPPDFASQKLVDLPISNDPDAEPTVESFLFRITAGTYGVRPPESVPVHIIDDDGGSRFSLEPLPDGSGPVTYSRSETFAGTSIAVPIFRGGPIGTPTSVGYTVQDGTAIQGEDYEPPPSPIVAFAANQRMATLNITIIDDDELEPPQTFQISIAGAGPDDENITTVTIIDNETDRVEPVTRFHHPRNGWKYRYGDYRIREMHVFFEDYGSPPSGVIAVELALRKKKLDGSCTWWANGRWNGGACDGKRWIPMKLDFDLYLKRFTPPLSPSMGTRIKNYTAWCRGIDGGGNVESSFTPGRNWSTFEVRPR